MTSPPSTGLFFSAESSPSAVTSPISSADFSENRDIHIAAEALESLRSVPVSNQSFVLPPIQPAASASPINNQGPYLRHNHHKITHSYRNRNSPYHSRSSSFSDQPSVSPGPTSPSLSSIDSANSRRSSRYPNFLNPLVSSAVRVYENSKSFSPRFKVSAEKLESVISSRMTTNSPNSNSFSASPSPPASQSPSVRQDPPTTLPPLRSMNSPNVTPTTSSTNLSKWLVTATSIATTLSYENRQRLRYCLHLLKLANTHIATKVNQLQELLQEEKAAAMAQSIASEHVPNDYPHRKKRDPKVIFTQTVNNIKKDIIWTIRKVVSALSTYAGNSLPEPARSHVRSYILRLPQRWVTTLAPEPSSSTSSTVSARKNGSGSSFGLFRRYNATNNPRDATVSPTRTPPVSAASGSQALSPPSATSGRHHKRTFSGESVYTDDGTSSLMSPITSNTSSTGEDLQSSSQNSNNSFSQQHTEIGNRVLSLANEALDMLGSIINIVDETLERANMWCEQQRQQQQPAGSSRQPATVNVRVPPSGAATATTNNAAPGQGQENGVELNSEKSPNDQRTANSVNVVPGAVSTNSNGASAGLSNGGLNQDVEMSNS